jgi:hypothetical protein
MTTIPALKWAPTKFRAALLDWLANNGPALARFSTHGPSGSNIKIQFRRQEFPSLPEHWSVHWDKNKQLVRIDALETGLVVFHKGFPSGPIGELMG